MPKVEIKVGQVWRDKDKRREQEGNVRTFRITLAPAIGFGSHITVEEDSGKRHRFPRSRFGSGRANDSFELVEDVDA